MFGRKSHKIHESAHLKGGTAGTSNEVSFSVLDAASKSAEERKGAAPKLSLGAVPLFFVPGFRRGKRSVSTPAKDKGLTLSTGEFVAGSTDSGAVANALANSGDITFGEANRNANIESSDMLGLSSGETGSGGKGGTRKLPSIGLRKGTAKSKDAGEDAGGSKAEGKAGEKAAKRAEKKAAKKAAKKAGRAVSGKHALDARPKEPGRAGSAGGSGAATARTGVFGKRTGIDDEVGRRKRRRRRARIFAIVAGIAAVVALVGVGIVAANRISATHVAQSGTVDAAVQEIGSVDGVIVEMDDLLTSGLDTGSLSKIEKCLAKVPDAEKRLAAARVVAQDAAEDMQFASDVQYAMDAECAIDARLEMLDAGTSILKEAKSALAAKKLLDDAWSGVLTADSAIRTAASELAKSGDAQEAAAARDKLIAARDELAQTVSGVNGAQAAYPKASLSAAVSYIEKRVEAVDHAVAAANALIVEDTETAKTEIEAYTEADAQATQLARGMSAGDPSSLIADAYDDVVADEVKAYREARLRAATYDADLRTRLNAAEG